MEAQWGGDIGARMARRAREWEARPAGTPLAAAATANAVEAPDD
jgi:hypothetical protein